MVKLEVYTYMSTFSLIFKLKKNLVVVLESHFGWWNYWLSGTYKRCLMKSIEWRVGPLSFNKRGVEGGAGTIWSIKISNFFFIHDCIIGIVQNSIVKWKYGWQVLELHSIAVATGRQQHGGRRYAGHLKRYIPLWL